MLLAGLLCGPVPGERPHSDRAGTFSLFIFNISHFINKEKLPVLNRLVFFSAGDPRPVEVLAENLQPEGGALQIPSFCVCS